jgi:DNA polymerase-3 subunit delta'
MPVDLVVHSQTATALARLAQTRPHAIILDGPGGIGKRSLALQLAADIIGNDEPLKALQQVLLVERGDDSAVNVEKIRQIDQFLSRKLPGGGTRLVIIDDAHAMRREAQNALLKTLEEPPESTMLILLSANQTNLLPTVRSRAVTATIKRPTHEQLKAYFGNGSRPASDIDRALLMSGGLPGLMHALLEGADEHPLKEAALLARQIMQSSRFERLVLADKLAKQREQAIAVCDMLQQMAHIKLEAGAVGAPWPKLLTESYEASERLRMSAQPKLLLTSLMLSL